MATQYDNVSWDLIWETVRHRNAFLVKRKQAGGVQFSRDPLNVMNVHSRKYSSLANPTAIGINPGKDNSVVVTTKVAKNQNKPAKAVHTTTFKSSTPSRKIYRSVVSSTAKKGYRADIRAETVARASAVKKTFRNKQSKTSAAKPRGRKAKAKGTDA